MWKATLYSCNDRIYEVFKAKTRRNLLRQIRAEYDPQDMPFYMWLIGMMRAGRNGGIVFDRKGEVMSSDIDVTFNTGFADRMAGFYDKWYRYYCRDHGAEYDRGVKAAVERRDCPMNCTIIECRTSFC